MCISSPNNARSNSRRKLPLGHARRTENLILLEYYKGRWNRLRLVPFRFLPRASYGVVVSCLHMNSPPNTTRAASFLEDIYVLRDKSRAEHYIPFIDFVYFRFRIIFARKYLVDTIFVEKNGDSASRSRNRIRKGIKDSFFKNGFI